MGSQVYWCLGMYASASTWLFNVVRQIHALNATEKLQSHFFSGIGNFAGFEQPDVVNIVKSHEIKDEATIVELTQRAGKIFVTMRDPRDAITSLMLYHNYTFERALPLIVQAGTLCMDFSRDRRVLFYRYESGFFDDQATVTRIAKHLGYALTDDQARQIFASMSRAQVEKYIAKMPKMKGILQDHISGDQLDPQTHWHSHHAGRSGEIGRWRQMLSPKQAAKVEQSLGSYGFATATV